MRFDEEAARLIGRIAAQEAFRLAQGVPLGRAAQVAGVRIPFEYFELDLSSAGTYNLGGPVRSLQVLAGGHPSVSLRVWGEDNRSKDLAAVAGAGFLDAPAARVELVIPASLKGTIRIGLSDTPGAFAPVSAAGVDWTPFELSSGEDAGDTNLVISLTAGLEYELFGAFVRVHNDATAANRFPTLIVRDTGGNNIFALVRATANATASERALLAVNFGGGEGQSQAVNPGVGVNYRWTNASLPRRHVAVVSAPTAAHFEVYTSGGQAGDTHELIVTGLCRPLSARSIP